MAVTTVHVAQADKTQSPYQLDPEQTLKASQALLGHVQAEAKRLLQSSANKNLLATADSDDDEGADEDDQPIWLNLATKQHIVDKNRLKPSKIPVPHSLNASDGLTICLITTDPQRAVKNVVADVTFPTSLSARITRIIGLTKLQARYKSFEQKRELLSEHDIFLADDRIITRLPKILGKIFYKGTAKRPIPVNIAPRERADGKKVKTAAKKVPKEDREAAVASPTAVAKEIEKALNSVPVSLRPGLNVSVRVGLASFTSQQIAENIATVATAIIEKHVAKGWRNVKSVHIKSPASFAVPVWLSDDLWTDGENIIENMMDGVEKPKELENEQVDEKKKKKKRKRTANTAKGPQSGERKKVRLEESIAIEKEEGASRKRRLAAQKARAFQSES